MGTLGFQSSWRKCGTLLIAGVLCLLLAACGGANNASNSGFGGSNSNNNNNGNNNNTGTSQIPSVLHVVLVVLENTDYSSVVGSANAPYLNSLIPQGGLVPNYYANTHPSIGNYFVLTTGEVVTNDDSFSGMVSVDNVVRQLSAVSKTWKVYAENLPSVGYLGGDVPPLYLRHHNPMTYFSVIQMDPTAQLNIVPYTQLPTDLANAQLPAYSLIIPNAIHDAHTCNDGTQLCDVSERVKNADTWLSTNLPPILNDAGFQQSGLLIITFDESADDLAFGGGKVMTLILGTKVKPGYSGTGQYNHDSLLNLTMTALGAKSPNDGGSAAPMTEFFQP